MFYFSTMRLPLNCFELLFTLSCQSRARYCSLDHRKTLLIECGYDVVILNQVSIGLVLLSRALNCIWHLSQVQERLGCCQTCVFNENCFIIESHVWSSLQSHCHASAGLRHTDYLAGRFWWKMADPSSCSQSRFSRFWKDRGRRYGYLGYMCETDGGESYRGAQEYARGG